MRTGEFTKNNGNGQVRYPLSFTLQSINKQSAANAQFCTTINNKNPRKKCAENIPTQTVLTDVAMDLSGDGIALLVNNRINLLEKVTQR
jgi:hypothetical protein